MRTKRQPTIKTWLLTILIVSVLCAFFRYRFGDYFTSKGMIRLSVTYGAMLGSAVAFWTALPLALSLAIRSLMRVGASCLAVGIIWALFVWLTRPYITGLVSDWVFGIIEPTIAGMLLVGTFYGPHLWILRLHHLEFGLNLVLIAGWLITFATIGILFAKSCRLRESADFSPERKKCSVVE